ALIAPAAAVATATTAATAVAAAATAAATAAFGPRLGLVDRQRATVAILAVEGLDGRLGLLLGLHFHEAEALGSPRVPVHADLGRLHGAVRLEQLRQFVVGDLVGQVADVQLLAH